MESYDLSDVSYRVLILTVSAVPAFITWFAAFYGYEQLRRYTVLIRGSKEAKAFRQLTQGAAWVAYALPVLSTIFIWLTAIANNHQGFRWASVVIINYATVVVALISFNTLGVAARNLSAQNKARPSYVLSRGAIFAYLAILLFYCYYLFSHSMNAESFNPYHLPPWLLLVTIILPFAYAWLIGVIAALDIAAYASKVRGILYRRALQFLASGVLIIIVSNILLQYVNSANVFRGELVLNGILLIRYVLYFGLALGFGLVGYGAKRLQRIEQA